MRGSQSPSVYPGEAEEAGTAVHNLPLLHSPPDGWAGFIEQPALRAMLGCKWQGLRNKPGCHLSARATGEEPGRQMAEGRVAAFSHFSLIYHCVVGLQK